MAWGRRRRRKGTNLIFGEDVLKVKVMPTICAHIFCSFCFHHQCSTRGWFTKFRNTALHCSPKSTIGIIHQIYSYFPILPSEPNIGWCLVEILKLMLGRDSDDEIWSRFVFELVIWTQPSGPLCLWQCLNKKPPAARFARFRGLIKEEYLNYQVRNFRNTKYNESMH